MSCGECGAGHDDGRDFVVEFIAEDTADFDGCAGECHALDDLAGVFDPVDRPFNGLAGPCIELSGQELAAIGSCLQFDLGRFIALFLGLFADFE